MTKRTITFDDDLNEINTITLDRELRSRDVSAVELGLRALAAGGDGNGGSNWPDDLGDVSASGVGTSTPGYGNATAKNYVGG